MIQLMRSTLVERLASLESRKSQIELEMTEIYTHPTRLLMAPRLPERAARPKRLLVVVMAAFIGLFLGVAAALISESFAKRREGSALDGVQAG